MNFVGLLYGHVLSEGRFPRSGLAHQVDVVASICGLDSDGHLGAVGVKFLGDLDVWHVMETARLPSDTRKQAGHFPTPQPFRRSHLEGR